MKIQFVVIVLLATFSNFSLAQECSLSVDQLKGNLNLANRGRIQAYIEKQDKAGACFEAGTLRGFVSSTKAQAVFCHAMNFANNCKAKLDVLDQICGSQYSSKRPLKLESSLRKDFFATLGKAYFDATDCLEKIQGQSLPAQSEPQPSTAVPE